ncbi:MAG: M42 family metallopeptidase [Armatimonadetes bacterium]|nr:M42 family metallopeptidase [Armatimonadota bacterium]
MARFEIDTHYLVQTLQDLLNTPSPTGDTEWAISFVQQELEAMGITAQRTKKGALLAKIDGIRSTRKRGVSAHVDTLGAMVAEIKPSGRLRMTALNGVMWPTVESEGVTIATSGGRQIRGSIVLTNGAVHVNPEGIRTQRDDQSLEIRIDERTRSREETRLLGIEVGDFVYFDPRVEVSESGFVRSRFLDDKACVAIALASFKALKDAGVAPADDTYLLISNYEEVGHGGADSMPPDLDEFLILDMACVGVGQNGDEHHCSICTKDSSGPYSKALTDRLRAIADHRGIDLRTDIYPRYGSDGSAYWRAGGTAQVALIGPGVDTSHGYERTHTEALRDTALLLAEYLMEDE